MKARAMPTDTRIVTVIIPVFNSATTLARAAGAALRQTVASLEALMPSAMLPSLSMAALPIHRLFVLF